MSFRRALHHFYLFYYFIINFINGIKTVYLIPVSSLKTIYILSRSDNFVIFDFRVEEEKNNPFRVAKKPPETAGKKSPTSYKEKRD